MFRKSRSSDIEKLNPVTEHCEIMRLLVGSEFPWDYQRSLIDLTFLRVLAMPTIAGLFRANGYLQTKTQKRYDDTCIIVIGFIKEGYASERGARLLTRMNEVHKRFHVRNDDYIYTLTVLMVEPVRWNARFGWRRMSEKERDANYYFWREVGVRMGIDDIPESYDACERFKRTYEQEHFKRTVSSVELSTAILNMLENWYPSFVRPAVRPIVSALLDAELLDSFAISPPPEWLRAAVVGALQLRAKALPWIPTSERPWFVVDGRIRSYPNGYKTEDLGPPVDWHRSMA